MLAALHLSFCSADFALLTLRTRRVLALGSKALEGEEAEARALTRSAAERGLTFRGFLVLHCPPKPESAAVLEALRSGERPAGLSDEALAVALRVFFESMGATYVKLGQFVASSPTIFPAAFVTEMQKCLDNTPPTPWASSTPRQQCQGSTPIPQLPCQLRRSTPLRPRQPELASMTKVSYN